VVRQFLVVLFVACVVAADGEVHAYWDDTARDQHEDARIVGMAPAKIENHVVQKVVVAGPVCNLKIQHSVIHENRRGSWEL